MHVIHANNVGDALYKGIRYLTTFGIEDESRNGPVLVSPMPVTTVYHEPWNRVLLDPVRDANPFFHLIEAAWMLAGRQDLASLTYYLPRMKEFSDDGLVMPGAYGYRWRQRWGFDQLEACIKQLTDDPSSRRVVLQMWSPSDLVTKTKDKPCNTQIYFMRNPHTRRLDMTLTCRSNDIIWGAYGANAVHFSILHEYVAAFSGMDMGTMYQISNNFHMYKDREDVRKLLMEPARWVKSQPYPMHTHLPLVQSGKTRADFDRDLYAFFSSLDNNVNPVYTTEWVSGVLGPVSEVWDAYIESNKVPEAAMPKARLITDLIWQKAVTEWLERRRVK